MKFVATNATAQMINLRQKRFNQENLEQFLQTIRRGVGTPGRLWHECVCLCCLFLFHIWQDVCQFRWTNVFFCSSSRKVGVLTLTKAVEVKTQDIFKILRLTAEKLPSVVVHMCGLCTGSCKWTLICQTNGLCPRLVQESSEVFRIEIEIFYIRIESRTQGQLVRISAGLRGGLLSEKKWVGLVC